jgi:hypothetical protein
MIHGRRRSETSSGMVLTSFSIPLEGFRAQTDCLHCPRVVYCGFHLVQVWEAMCFWVVVRQQHGPHVRTKRKRVRHSRSKMQGQQRSRHPEHRRKSGERMPCVSYRSHGRKGDGSFPPAASYTFHLHPAFASHIGHIAQVGK